MIQFSALAGGRVRITGEDKVRFSEELGKFTTDGDDISTARSIWTIGDYVPGIDTGKRLSGGDAVFNISQLNIGLREAKKRMGSPQHYRYYFAFFKPSGSLDDGQLQEFIYLAAIDQNAAAAMFLQFVESKRPQGGTVADLLIDR